MTPQEFIQLTASETADSPLVYGRIDPSYSSGNPRILFDGETTLSVKTYPFLSSYKATANDRVAILKTGRYYLILGKFDGTFIDISKLVFLTVNKNINLDILQGAGTLLSATTGTITVTMDGSIKTITPTGSCVFNASGGVSGQRCTFVITTSGSTAFTLTWSSGFKAVGTLSTGTTTGKMYAVDFIFSGSMWVETGRTAAM